MLLPVLLLAAVLLGASSSAVAQTTVSARGDDGQARVLLEDGAVLADPSSALGSLPGVLLLRDGAPLSPARVSVRGVAGARVSASFAGIALHDPLDGLLDVEMLPWIAVRMAALDPASRALRLEPDARTTLLRARVLAGSLSTLRLGALASTPTANGRLLVAADAGATRGDFVFAVPSARIGDAPALAVRDNDDHKRASTLVLGDERLGLLEVDGALLGSVHEGGVPGFATHPTAGLRREDLLGGGFVRGTHSEGALRLFGSGAARGTRRSTHEQDAPVRTRDSVSATALRAETGGELSGADASARLTAHLERAEARVVGGEPTGRVIGGLGSRGAVTLPFGLDVDAEATADFVSDTGPLFSGRLRAATGDSVRAAVALSRASRPPTLDELYAPRGFVLGNPELSPEVLDDVEVSVSARAGALLLVGAALWAGRIEDTILYLNENAFEIRPVNTGPALRGGLELVLSAKPARVLGIDSVASILVSRVDATGAQLPLAPLFTANTAIRLGQLDEAHALARFSSRTSSSASQFGTLAVSGYTLVDLVAVYPLGEHLALGVSIKNAFDVLDARDQNGLPLPGRLFFASLEVRG